MAAQIAGPPILAAAFADAAMRAVVKALSPYLLIGSEEANEALCAKLLQLFTKFNATLQAQNSILMNRLMEMPDQLELPK